ncbi:cleavage and polyadenylation specificity factor subunit 1 [Phlebotomus papatasi]|uniref:cleavage and polyadenylation specificity factor subunit 1 n=1 Tax=Phlebotomus papatasi TaxID=29031 RepID=UPI0024836B09|nr:cleavage and polyadenylation specificity factor subunit 1 [Phlebotomus papatasi]
MFSAICKQTHPATGIEFSISCHFFNNSEKNLVTAGANILKVFRIVPDVEPHIKEKYTDIRPPKMRLECVAMYTLYGNVMSLQSVSLAGSQRDALLVSFKDAKLSVVQHDPDTYDLKTLSLHYFEEEEIRGGWTGNYHVPIVRVDPDNRCAVMLVYGRKLVVLPFRKDSTLDEIELQDVKPMKKPPIQLIARTPILASYIITLKDLDEKVDNIIDIQFLHGYYEPTLLILYEPVRTFPGRIAVRSDTCTMVAISLNIQQRVHPVIWSFSGLPFDCCQVVPVNKPIGGCLVVSVNAIIYLNQSVPPYGVSVNSIADHSTQFPLKPQDGVKITLDTAQMTFIENDKLVMSLKNGELYVLTLCADSMRSVRSFHFSKAASSVLTSCICVCEEEYLFLGSRLGNSLLLRLTQKDQSMVITIEDTEKEVEKEKDVMTKQRRLEEEELEVYGSGPKTSVQLTSFTFEVCDSVLNIGPIGHMCVGQRAKEEDQEEEGEHDEDTAQWDLEIVTSSGHGKNGALCVLQNSIKPQIITSFGLTGCTDVWTVADDSGKKVEKVEDSTHAFMILSQENATMVLQTGDEINEIEKTGFCNNLPTIFVGNVGNNRYIVQVTTKSIRLLQGARLLQNIPFDKEAPLATASVADPYVCVLSQKGVVLTLALREAKGTPRLAVNKNTVSPSPPVKTLCSYRDTSGMFTSKYEDYADRGQGNNLYNTGFGYMKPEPNMKIEDEEDLLYGDAGNSFKVTSMAEMAVGGKKGSEWWRRYLQASKPTYWLLVTRSNGNLEIYSMPDLKLTYLVNNVANGNKVLTDSMEYVPLITNPEEAAQGDVIMCGPQCQVSIQEILIVGLGSHGNRPLLIIRTEMDILIYKVFRYAKGHLKIRFRKVSHDIIHQNSEAEGERFVNHLRYFGNIFGYNGVAICGKNPHFVLLTPKGEFRTHRLYGKGVIKSFAPFNNINCPNGFLYFDDSSELKIAVFPKYLTYDADWPMRKIPLRCTPMQICYHTERKIYCLVTNTSEVSQKYYRFNGEDKELTEENKGERFMYPTVDKFTVLLVAPTTWEIVPSAQIDLDEWEHVTAFKNVSLLCEGTRSGLKEYICVGTNYNYSEDITSRGRILIYDIIEVVPEPGKPLTRYRFKEVYTKEQKGPVSAITHVLGFLVTAVGQKIYLWQLKDGDLVGVAFIDTNIYVHEMVSIKSLILVADVYKSISILRFQEEYRTLSLVSRDFQAQTVFSAEYVVDNSNLGFLATDVDGNIIIYMYHPESRESFGGQKLLRKADYHLGQRINTMFRIQCHLREHQRQDQLERRISNYDHKHITFFGTLDGGLGFCLPLPEKTYRRLFMLQNLLMVHSSHLCGLNPKVFRTIKSSRKMQANPARCIVDGELIWSFIQLPMNEKMELAKKIGTRIDEIYSDLAEIHSVTAVF